MNEGGGGPPRERGRLGRAAVPIGGGAQSSKRTRRRAPMRIPLTRRKGELNAKGAHGVGEPQQDPSPRNGPRASKRQMEKASVRQTQDTQKAKVPADGFDQ